MRWDVEWGYDDMISCDDISQAKQPQDGGECPLLRVLTRTSQYVRGPDRPWIRTSSRNATILIFLFLPTARARLSLDKDLAFPHLRLAVLCYTACIAVALFKNKSLFSNYPRNQ